MSDQTINCPCGSGQSYEQCCSVYHQGTLAPTAEKLMRSRFTAYFMGLVDYLVATTWPRQQPILQKEDIHNRADNTQWLRLEIVETLAGQATDNTGVVEFRAWFTQPPQEQEQVYQERSDFIRENNHWYFIYPNLTQTPATVSEPGRNDPCSCGSGRKYKKCCMK